MAEKVQDVLVKVLENLEENTFMKFKDKLNNWEIKEGFSKIPESELKSADPEDAAELIRRYYKDSYGTEVTLAVLEAIGERQEAETLRKDLKTDQKHFVDTQCAALIEQVTLVDPILDDLYQNNLLTAKAYEHLRNMKTSQEKMQELFRYVTSWEDKDQLLKSLRRHNPQVLIRLEEPPNVASIANLLRHLSDDVNNISRSPASILLSAAEHLRKLLDYEFIFPQTGWFPVSIQPLPVAPSISSPPESGPSSSAATSVSRPSAQKSCVMDCSLCGKVQEGLAVPVITENTHRLVLTTPGLYQCQKTGLRFLVKGPVIIEYTIVSWSKYIEEIPIFKYEILGPLFDIKILDEPNAVSAVHLPHHLCVKGFTGDLSLVKCAHYKDGNMKLETPTTIEPFYVTLENPTFSLMGVLLSGWRKKIPIHGIVLIYFRILCKDEPDEEYRIHLYLLPYSNSAEQSLDEKKKKFGYQRIDKPIQTKRPVYTRVKYLVSSQPEAYVCPETLEYHSGHQSEPYQSTEISVMGNYMDIQLLVEAEKTKDTIWKATLRRGEIKENIQSSSGPTIHKGSIQDLTLKRDKAGVSSQEDHFVDRHRKTLIENISSIYQVLDELLSRGLLTPEQYDIVRVKSTHQGQMRELYEYIKGWGHSDKDILHDILKRCYKSLIRKLESA